MKIDLSKDDLISLAKGTNPHYSVMENPLIQKHGSYSASYGTWNWECDAFDECSEEQILEIYKLCKNSWNKS